MERSPMTAVLIGLAIGTAAGCCQGSVASVAVLSSFRFWSCSG